jgi:lysophospholipase L1-like esterase
MPSIEYSVDEGPFKVVQLSKTREVYVLPLAESLDAKTSHRLDFYFRSADLTRHRWRSPTSRLRIAGLAMDAGGELLPRPTRPKRAIGFGDSIMEGVGLDSLFTSWQSIAMNNARGSWFPIVCAALNCEYGQIGSGGLGMSNTKMEMPPLPRIWDHYETTTSRLTGGLLLPEPDYVFCCLGTNDPGLDITADYIGWLTAMRQACPSTRFFCIVPPLGLHRTEVRAAVSTRNKAGDQKVYLLDTASLEDAFRAGRGPTQLAYDGVHPSQYGQALLSTMIAVEVQKILSRETQPATVP